MALIERIQMIGLLLNNESYPLKKRFRALFTLKNLGGEAAIDEIVKCFSTKSALLKHELAYCLGQMKNAYAIPKLVELLQDASQEIIVRHEAGNWNKTCILVFCMNQLDHLCMPGIFS